MNSNPAFASLLRIRFAVLLALAAGSGISAFGQQSATWNSTSSTTWSTGSNWVGNSAPGIAASDRATFNSANSTINPNLTTSATTGAITFATGNFTLSSASASTSLTLLGNGTAAGTAALINTAGNNTISAPLIFGASDAQWIRNESAGNLNISGNITKSSGNLTFSNANTSTAISVSGNITAAGKVSSTGGAGITLSGNNSAGSWDISSAITLNSAGALGSSGSINWSGNGQLVFTANNTTDYSSRFTVDLNQRYTLGVNGAANSVTLASALTGNGTSAFQAGGSTTTGTVVLGNASNSFSGPVTVAGGTLSVAGIGNTGSNSHLGTNGTIILGASSTAGTLLYTGAGELTGKVINLGGTTGGATITNNGSGTLTLTSNTTATGNGSKTFTLGGSGNGRFSGVIANGANATISLTKTGAGTWTLSGNNSYTGTTAVNGGILVFGNTSAKASGAVTANASGTIGLGVGAASGDFSDANVTTLFNTGNLLVNTSNLTLNSASGVAIDTTAGNFTQSSALTAARALTKLGNNMLTLSGNNTYTGNTTIRAGTLQLAKTASLYNATTANWTASRIIVNSGATLALNVGGTGEFSAANVTTLMTNLSGANGNATQGFAAGSFIALDTTNAPGANFVFADTIFNSTGIGGGAVGLTKLGSGTLTLSGNNTYTGATTINSGTLQIGNGADSGSIASTSAVINNGALVYNVGDGNRTLAAAISGSGSLAQNSSGTLTLTGNNTYTGPTLINSGTLQIGNGADSGSIASTSAVTNNGALVYNVGLGNRTLAAAISGSGSLTQNSSGTLTLTGTNTYTGATSVNAGTLLIDGSTNSDSIVTVDNGATLGGLGTINGATNIINGNLAPGNGGVGVLTFGSSLVLGSQANVSFTLNGTTRGTDYNGIDLDPLNSDLNYGGNLTINVASQFLSSSNENFTLFSGVVNGTPLGNLASVSLSGAYGDRTTTINNGGVWDLADSSGNQWSFNQSTGNLAFTAIPEPSVYALLLTGLAAMAILNHRRRKARADVVSK